jgi:cell division protein FtsQ
MPLSNNLQLEFRLFGRINKKNNEELAQLFRVIYDDDFLKKNIIAIQIMPNGSLKCSIEILIIKLILEVSNMTQI